MKSSDFDRDSHYASSKQLPISVHDINFKEPGTPMGSNHSPLNGATAMKKRPSSL